MSPVDLIGRVRDRDSFLAFVSVLADERERAEQLERADPVRYQLGGALDWQNGSISTYLNAAVACFQATDSDDVPSWRLFAEFLYAGKVYE
jgi:hypothetical protein